MRRYYPNGIADYDAPSPRASPFFEDRVSIHAIGETGHEGSLRISLIAS
jgi:hypothetical protein